MRNKSADKTMKLHETTWRDGKPQRKFSDEQVRKMRELREQGLTNKEIGKMFGTSPTTAREICKRQRYGDIP